MASLPTIDKPPRVMPAEHRKTLFDAIGHPPVDLARLLESTREKIDAIDQDRRFTDAAKEQMRADVLDGARRDFSAGYQRHHDASVRSLSTEEGRLRAALKNDAPALEMGASDNDRARLLLHEQRVTNLQQRVALDLRELDAATDLAEVLDIFTEAEAVSGETMRRVGRHAVRRAEALFKAQRSAMPGDRTAQAMASPEARLVADIRERYAVWAKANPTPAQRLRQVVDQKAILEQQLESQRDRWVKAYGWL